MEKTILLGSGNHKFSLKAQRGLYFFVGALFLLQGSFHFWKPDSRPGWWWILTVLLMLGGIFYFFMALTITSERSKYSPKVKVTDGHIEFRRGFFQKNTTVRWADVKAVTLLSYSMIFELTEGVQKLEYLTSASTSREIKEVIWELAETKGIVVAAG